MLSIDLDIYVQLPDGSKQRVLHPAKVSGIDGNLNSIILEEDTLTLKENTEILVYYDLSKTFVQQSARINKVETLDAKLTAQIELCGRPVSAESRQFYRVSLITAELFATFGPEENCRLNDVSMTGFSVTSANRYEIGAQIPVSVEFEKKQYSGTAAVQSIREYGEKKIRYGLHCIDDKKLGGNLEQGLRQISSVIQRQQMRRLAGTQ